MTTPTLDKMNAADIRAKTKEELAELAAVVGIDEEAIENCARREDLLSKVLQAASAQQCLVASGILEIMDEGYGFLRQVNTIGGAGDGAVGGGIQWFTGAGESHQRVAGN